jgi:hypothetical protein
MRRWSVVAVAAVALTLPACEGGGNFSILGYTTRPNYDLNIHTVYVPIFKNLTFWRGMEFELTKAVVTAIEAGTPYKVVSDRSCADTELTGTIVSFNKNILLKNQQNEVRNAETTLGVEVVWRDLRTGEILSRPRPAGPSTVVPSIASPDNLAGGPLGPIPGVPSPVPPAAGAPAPTPTPPVLVQSIGGFIPELGQSLSTAQQQNVNKLARQIVFMMEKPW